MRLVVGGGGGTRWLSMIVELGLKRKTGPEIEFAYELGAAAQALLRQPAEYCGSTVAYLSALLQIPYPDIRDSLSYFERFTDPAIQKAIAEKMEWADIRLLVAIDDDAQRLEAQQLLAQGLVKREQLAAIIDPYLASRFDEARAMVDDPAFMIMRTLQDTIDFCADVGKTCHKFTAMVRARRPLYPSSELSEDEPWRECRAAVRLARRVNKDLALAILESKHLHLHENVPSRHKVRPGTGTPPASERNSWFKDLPSDLLGISGRMQSAALSLIPKLGDFLKSMAAFRALPPDKPKPDGMVYLMAKTVKALARLREKLNTASTVIYGGGGSDSAERAGEPLVQLREAARRARQEQPMH